MGTATTLFVIALTTSKMIMPGMPNLAKIPGMPDMSAPTRSMTMDLTSEQKPSSKFKAQCAVPEGLKLGPKVDLSIYIPQPVKETPGEMGKDEPGKTPEFKMKTYWGCSETVPAGQPRVIDTKEMEKAMKKGMKTPEFQNAWKHSFGSSTDGTHAYWPGENAKQIVKDSTAPGNYTLTTNYCGGTSITFDKPQDFLAPMDLIGLGSKTDLAKAIKVEWKPVPNAVAYYLTAFSGSEKEMIMWTSSSYAEAPYDLQAKALSKEKVAEYIKTGVLLPADKTVCYIPRGIFQTTGSATVMAMAIGADKIQVKDSIETNVVIRSTAMAMLGKSMMGMEEEEPADEETPKTIKKTSKSDDSEEEPAIEDKPATDDDSGSALDKAEEGVDKADDTVNEANRAKRTLKKLKGIFH